MKGQAKVLNDAAAVFPQHTEAMGIVHHQPGAPGPTQLGQPRQRGQIPIHAEHPVGHHQLAGGIAGGQATGQGLGVAVGVALEAGATEQAAIQQGSVIETGLEHPVSLPHNCADDT